MEEFFEEVPELCVEDGVDDGVEGAVDVAQPRHHTHQTGGDLAGLTMGPHGVDHEERCPAEQEDTCGGGGTETETGFRATLREQ